jgi:hypothetical protein
VQPFCIAEVGPKQYQWNCGGDSYKNVILFDEDVYPGNNKLSCPVCKVDIAAATAHIRGGRFVSAQAISAAGLLKILGDSNQKARAVTIGDDGVLIPREDWFDHVLKFVDQPGVGA